MNPDEPYRPVLTTQADLDRCWHRLMEPLGFDHTSIWMLLIGGGGVPIPLDDLPASA